MQVTQLALPEVLLIEPRLFPDGRGHFFESWVEPRYREAGIELTFVQDNFSRSTKNTLRGLHFQEPRSQGKLVTVLSGRVYDIVVDIRKGSPRFGEWVSIDLDGDSPKQVWLPPGFAHGFCVLSETADFFYKCTAFYSPDTERSVRWNDPELAIAWPIETPILSDKDAAAPFLADAPVFPEFADTKCGSS